jgi:hypothetical protein
LLALLDFFAGISKKFDIHSLRITPKILARGVAIGKPSDERKKRFQMTVSATKNRRRSDGQAGEVTVQES